MSNDNLMKIEAFKGILNQQTIRAQLKNSLKDRAGQFMSSMIDLYSSEISLQQCNPEQVAIECVKAAALDLPIVKSLGYAYIVPYKGKPTFTIGYRGFLQLAQRTNQYETINADVVREGELIGINKLSGEVNLDGEKVSDEVIGYFAYFKLLNGFQKTLYMSKQEMDNYASQYSPSFKSTTSPWKTEYDKMACKTVLKRLISKYGPTSIEMQKVELIDDKGINKSNIEDKTKKQVVDVVVTDVTQSDVSVNTDTGEIIEELPFDEN